MKSCPACHRTYEDDAMSFCLEDGTPLVSVSESSYDPGATMKIPAARLTSDAPTEVIREEQVAPTQTSPQAANPALPATPKYDAPATPAPAERKSSAALWILGAALVLGLSAIAVALIMTRGTGNSETAKQTNQTENTIPSMNTSPSTESGDISATNQAANPVDAPTTAGDAVNKTPTSKTTEQPTPTPKPTQTTRPTPTPESASTPEATPPPRRAPISGGVLNGKAISLPKPAYPAIARAARASGTVTVQVTVDESGKVISARAVSGHPLLQQSAVQAAYGARFSPTQLSGQPVKVTGVVTYNFVAQ
jgi:TonB family protein